MLCTSMALQDYRLIRVVVVARRLREQAPQYWCDADDHVKPGHCYMTVGKMQAGSRRFITFDASALLDPPAGLLGDCNDLKIGRARHP